MKASCDCWGTITTKLAERGFKIHHRCSAFTIGDAGLSTRHYLPIERIDGRKLQAVDPNGIAITHCPFCGAAYSP
jgi:hypothetical protein